MAAYKSIQVPVNMTPVTYKEVRSLYPMMQRGGFYSPRHCRSHNKTIIIIAYRDREKNLMIFLRNLIPFLIRQQAEFRIFVAEQTRHHDFNRAAMFNIGYLVARSLYNFTCFVPHDTDYVPVDFRNFYRCETHPKHLLVTRSELHHLGPKYPTAFGGALAISRPMFEVVNGFSNQYYGWGIEDDDLRRRYVMKNISLTRNDVIIGSYLNMPHKPQKRNAQRVQIYRKIQNTTGQDGLNSAMNKSVVSLRVTERELFTNVRIHLSGPVSP